MVLFSFYEFFAGAGLVRLGLGQSWSCAWANDIDPRKAEVYIANFGPAELSIGDIANIRAESLPISVDMAWASFPCQDLSLAGWQRGMFARRSGTFWAFWRIMRDLFDQGCRPPLIVIENVTGLLYGGHVTGLCEALASLGMQFGPLVIDARWFLPQSRPRVFMIAVDSRVNCEGFIEKSPSGIPWFPRAVLAAFAALPQSLSDLWRWWKLPIPTASPVPHIDQLIEDDPAGIDWHHPSETKRLLGMMTQLNLEKVQRAISQKGRSVGLVYKRTREGRQRPEVRFDGIAGCLRTPEGGSSRQIVVVVKNGKVKSRLLSPREAAKLMGVPDSFWLPPNYNDAYRAMGDGVAVPVVLWLSENLLTPLAKACSTATDAVFGGFDVADHMRFAVSRQIVEALAEQWEAVQA